MGYIVLSPEYLDFDGTQYHIIDLDDNRGIIRITEYEDKTRIRIHFQKGEVYLADNKKNTVGININSITLDRKYLNIKYDKQNSIKFNQYYYSYEDGFQYFLDIIPSIIIPTIRFKTKLCGKCVSHLLSYKE